MLKVYTFLSKFPFNFGIFKKSKIIVGYIYGDTKIEELIKVCSKKDISRILDYFVKKDDYKKITELLAYAPELLSIEKYSRFWMDVLKAYPEKALTVLEYAPSNEARIIKEVLVKKGIVSLDLEIISEKIVACGLVFFSPNDEEAILFFDEYEINYLKNFWNFFLVLM
ncbi:MAG: hypothetical protein J7K36_07290 [Archaeoglobaceae archaeon]|nr:hypothetical protein [Archaeoglobaceae archaeon]